MRRIAASVLWNFRNALPFSAPTARRGSVVPLIYVERCLASLLQRDDRQVPAATMELDFKLHLRPGTATHECPWLGARRASRPVVPWLIARAAVGRIATMVDFIGRLAAQPGVQAMRVVPVDDRIEFPLKCLLSVG